MSELAIARSWQSSTVPIEIATRWKTVEPAKRQDSILRKKIIDTIDMVTVKDQALRVLEKTESDWRSISSIARQVGASESAVARALAGAPEVRHPLAPSRPEDYRLYRLVERGLTRREKLRLWLLVLSRQAR
ncbi:hypothetical protein GCM10009737_32520 [Nocardioides lentus]|uniref:Uncharacterized protein n=1 Tax=Nocardioides lentus TaxID=338077 RepID=A0ABN2PTD1_9ACTN